MVDHKDRRETLKAYGGKNKVFVISLPPKPHKSFTKQRPVPLLSKTLAAPSTKLKVSFSQSFILSTCLFHPCSSLWIYGFSEVGFFLDFFSAKRAKDVIFFCLFNGFY